MVNEDREMRKTTQLLVILAMAFTLIGMTAIRPAYALGQITGPINTYPGGITVVEDNDDLALAEFPGQIGPGFIVPVGVGDEEEDVYEPDMDGDGIADIDDNCVDGYNPSQVDTDGDEIGNTCDNCRFANNPDQADSDDDGIGDLCVLDADLDGIRDSEDNCPTVSNPDQANEDNDFYGDACDIEAAPGTSTPEGGEEQFSADHNGGCTMVTEGSNSTRALGISIIFLFGAIVMMLERRKRHEISG